MKTILQNQQAQALLKNVGRATPVYLIRTPKGKKLLQVPQLLEIGEIASTMSEQASAMHKPVDVAINNL